MEINNGNKIPYMFNEYFIQIAVCLRKGIKPQALSFDNKHI